jgi:glyoxylase-like metal-dependent hydrolase (beta-lactamase superfamily II)
MQIKTFELNPLGVNTYILSDETKECVVIDAACFLADEKKLLINYILSNGFSVKHLINTHLHFDHILGVNALVEQFGVKLASHQGDEFLLEGLPEKMQMFGFPTGGVNYAPEIGHYLNDNDTIAFGNQQLKVIHLPGHSPGSLVFYHEASNSLFTGDVLFQASIGRTDLPGGNYNLLTEGVRTKLFTLPPETTVYPGHGPTTNIGYEKENNPFV